MTLNHTTDVAHTLNISFMPEVRMLKYKICGKYTSPLLHTREYLGSIINAYKTEEASAEGDQP